MKHFAIIGLVLLSQAAIAAPAKHVDPWQCAPGYICTKIEPAPPVLPITIQPPVFADIQKGDIRLMEGATQTLMIDGRVHLVGGSVVIKMPDIYLSAPQQKKRD